MICGFDSCRSYFAFIAAKEFIYSESREPYLHESNRLDAGGSILAKIVAVPLDIAIRNFKTPMAAVIFTIVGLAVATIFFYPMQTVAAVRFLFPWASHIGIGHVRACAYGVLQAVILGFGLRGLGRLNNANLMQAYRLGQIEPVAIGSSRLPF